ncbi:1-acyl-sn-glycerol-3-phosphate acyltransferase (plasmid) [Deinococcus taeanensis]|uniref:1-acyl-sn-glycerol-3-phosphate acyltransferase n=1 Tax=Deinococcus taeanensis TaxID=2737050 RepID=UPI001CDD0F34|nr:1-acyl-sn-glycerol-3-phosphate acyltransferase [Deinococcus taeanensis]UBV44587.1 1-acyl-sn-glycerol-3-phosphate acyltransferase [Deinococcus taeanensis]
MTDWLHFTGWGRAALWGAVRDVSRLPADLSPHQRDAAQKQVSARLLRHLRVRLEITGAECIGRGPYVVIALHESVVDVLALAQLPLPLRFVARAEIFSWPGVGPAITRLGHVSIDPESGSGGYRHLLRQARAITTGGRAWRCFLRARCWVWKLTFSRARLLWHGT